MTNRTPIGVGSTGQAVKDLQAALNLNAVVGHMPARVGVVPLKVDGIFGANTRKRLVEFQEGRTPALHPVGGGGPRTWAALAPYLASSQTVYDVPLVEQFANPVCWVACMAMVESERRQMSIGIGKYVGIDPSQGCIPNPATPATEPFFKTMERHGFESTRLILTPDSIEAALRAHGPLILTHYCAGFPYLVHPPPTQTEACHSIVVNGMDPGLYGGACWINNPWGSKDLLMSPLTLIQAAIKYQAAPPYWPAFAYYRRAGVGR